MKFMQKLKLKKEMQLNIKMKTNDSSEGTAPPLLFYFYF